MILHKFVIRMVLKFCSTIKKINIYNGLHYTFYITIMMHCDKKLMLMINSIEKVTLKFGTVFKALTSQEQGLGAL